MTKRIRILAALPLLAAGGVVGITSLVLHDIDNLLGEVADTIIGGDDA